MLNTLSPCTLVFFLFLWREGRNHKNHDNMLKFGFKNHKFPNSNAVLNQNKYLGISPVGEIQLFIFGNGTNSH